MALASLSKAYCGQKAKLHSNLFVRIPALDKKPNNMAVAKGRQSLRSPTTCRRTMWLLHKVTQTSPAPSSFCQGITFSPCSKHGNSFQLSCCRCHCYWLSIRHRVIKEWRRNCLGSAVALIALSEPSGRFFIKGGHEGVRGGGWRCPPDKSVRAGSHRLAQPGSNRQPQFRVGTWQAPLSNRGCLHPTADYAAPLDDSPPLPLSRFVLFICDPAPPPPFLPPHLLPSSLTANIIVSDHARLFCPPPQLILHIFQLHLLNKELQSFEIETRIHFVSIISVFVLLNHKHWSKLKIMN